MDLVIVGIAIAISIGLVVMLLTRQRAAARPADYEPKKQSGWTTSKRQQRIMEKLGPPPEIPTVMDLVREEVAETGVENIPGHEGLTGPVMLKVFRRDQAVQDRCTHDGYAFLIAEGVEPSEALEGDVTLYCEQCGPMDQPGTESVDETL
ncbi:MAG: hypothetical protein GY926_13665 [bacterium]|nr:hypothetical protein [bacterium]